MTFRAPVRELTFALNEVGCPTLLRDAFPDLDDDTVAAVLEAAGSFAESELAPLNRVGDKEGARYENGRVTLPAGFAEAYRAFADGGWNGLAADPEHGGQGLPKALELAVFEIVYAANMAFGLGPMLTLAAAEALAVNGTERQKRLVLPKLVSGEWTGAMNLTEPQAGSDLAAVATRAEPDGEGGYRLTGQKIFITWGDHDATENVCHLVLARTPDAPPGVKGISLFLAPKRLIDGQGRAGALNDLRPGSIEHKLGIHGSPTCVMLYEGARAELVGTLNEGLAHMFVMMNAARLQVGIQGVGVAEGAYQHALAFAQERRQGRAAFSGEYPARLYDHPDVRRTLMLMKSKTEASRATCLLAGVLSDLAERGADERARRAAAARRDLLIPIAKGWSTDVGVEVASLGVQVHGGMGFIEETGAAQYYRDARIAPIYEGTNGIQAVDLVGRKLGMENGAVLKSLTADIRATAEELSGASGLESVGAALAEGAEALDAAGEWLLQNRGAPTLAGATPFLQLAGEVVGGWMLGRLALAAQGAEAPWLRAKAPLARFYAAQVLGGAKGLARAVTAGAADLEAVEAEALGV